ncbi:SDR family NAD(P)-dependent oxidoreductase [Streptomyces sp. PSRA5]
MTTTLITGASKGLGFETARRLVAAGHTVHVGSRDPEPGRRAAERLGALPVVLDVTDEASVAAAAKTVTVEEGAEIIVRMAQLGPDGPTGGYFDVSGPQPW